MTPSRVLAAAVLLIAPLAPTAGLGQAPPAVAPPGQALAGMPVGMLAKLVKLVPATGSNGELPAAVAEALDLAPPGQPWPERQFAVVSSTSGAIHAVAVSRDGGQDVVISVRGPAAVNVYRLRPDGSLVRAVSYFPQTKLTMTVLPGQALDGLAGERQFWATHLDAIATPE